MTVRSTIDRFRREQRDAVGATVAQTMAAWRAIDPDNIAESWEQALPAVTSSVSAGQRRAAESGARYVPQVVAAQGVTPQPAGQVNVGRLAGVASDGRPLEGLLGLPAAQTLRRVGQGMPPAEALDVGRRRVGMLAVTQVADAGRMATSVGMTADRQVGGYRRQITPPACARCAILAGAWYRWNTGFSRHPSCQCVHVPAVGGKDATAGLETFDPNAYFESLDPAQQDRIFTTDGAAAIRDGSDMGQVVNARRGMKTTTMYGRKVSTTTVGTSKRGSAARVMRRETDAQFQKVAGQRYRRLDVPRLTPEQIYADANGNRDEAIRLLGRFGYLS